MEATAAQRSEAQTRRLCDASFSEVQSAADWTFSSLSERVSLSVCSLRQTDGRRRSATQRDRRRRVILIWRL